MAAEVCAQTPHPKNTSAVLSGTPRSVGKDQKPCKLIAPESFTLFAHITEPFEIFLEEFVPKYRSENPGLSKAQKRVSSILPIARDQWNQSLADEEKSSVLEKYVDLCKQQDLDVVWEEDASSVKKSESKKGDSKKRKAEPAEEGEDGKKKKKKRPLSGYMVFLETFRKTYQPAEGEKGGIAGCAKAGGAAWKKLTKKEQEEYKEIGIRRFNGEEEEESDQEEETKEESSDESESEEEAKDDAEEELEDEQSNKRKGEELEESEQQAKKPKAEADPEAAAAVAAAAAEKALEKKRLKEEKAAAKAAKAAEKEAKEAEKEHKAAKKQEEAAAKAAAKEAKAAEKEAKAAEKAKAKAEAERLNPKKPKTVFGYFMESFRPGYKEENPDASVSDTATAAKAAWEGMEQEAKQPFVTQHEEATALYLQRCSELGIEAKVKEVKPKKPKAPSAFELYAAQKEDLAKKRYPGLDGDALEKKLAFMWKNTSKSERNDYTEKARAAKRALAEAAPEEAAAEETAPEAAAPEAAEGIAEEVTEEVAVEEPAAEEAAEEATEEA